MGRIRVHSHHSWFGNFQLFMDAAQSGFWVSNEDTLRCLSLPSLKPVGVAALHIAPFLSGKFSLPTIHLTNGLGVGLEYLVFGMREWEF